MLALKRQSSFCGNLRPRVGRTLAGVSRRVWSFAVKNRDLRMFARGPVAPGLNQDFARQSAKPQKCQWENDLNDFQRHASGSIVWEGKATESSFSYRRGDKEDWSRISTGDLMVTGSLGCAMGVLCPAYAGKEEGEPATPRASTCPPVVTGRYGSPAFETSSDRPCN